MHRVIAALCLAPMTVFAAPDASAQFGFGNSINRPGVIIDTFPDRQGARGAKRVIAPDILAGLRGSDRAAFVRKVRSAVEKNLDSDVVERWLGRSGQLAISINVSRQKPAAKMRADPEFSAAARRDAEAKRGDARVSGLVLETLPPDTPCRRIEIIPAPAAAGDDTGHSLPSSTAIACKSDQGYWDAALVLFTPSPPSSRR